MDELSQIIAQYGIYAVFALCTIEGDITLLISGAMAHSGYFGNYSWLKVLFFGTVGGMAGDCVAYGVGRGIFLQRSDHVHDRRLQTDRDHALLHCSWRCHSVLCARAILDLRKGRRGES